MLIVFLCSGGDNDEAMGTLEGGGLLLLFLSPVLLWKSSGWPRGALLLLLAPVKFLDNGVDDLLGVDNLLGVVNLLGAGGEDVLFTVEAFNLV